GNIHIDRLWPEALFLIASLNSELGLQFVAPRRQRSQRAHRQLKHGLALEYRKRLGGEIELRKLRLWINHGRSAYAHCALNPERGWDQVLIRRPIRIDVITVLDLNHDRDLRSAASLDLV